MEKEKTVQSSPSELITPKEKGILINGIKYSYSITKSENEEESLIIKLYEPNEKSDIYFTYAAPLQKLNKDIKFLSLCENIDEMIVSLKEVFSQGNATVEEEHGEYNMVFKVSGFGIKKKCFIQLTKHEIEQAKKPTNESVVKINKIENKINDLYNKFENLRTQKVDIIKEENIRNIVKEVIFNKDIKNKLFEEMEQLLLSKYNLNKIHENKDNKVEDDIIDKVKDVIKIKEEKISSEIISIQEQLKENIEYLNEIKSSFNNYIILQVEIKKWELNEDIRLLNQVKTYKNFCNFERDDIEVIIDNQIIPIIFKANSDNTHSFYWKFSKKGMYNVKIIFKKKLLSSHDLFKECRNIYKIDCSNFDCSQILDCSRMFCINENSGANLTEINLGKLDFALSKNFEEMFYHCFSLIEI